MKNIFILIMLTAMVLSAKDSKMDYWKIQRKGAICSFKNFREEWFKEAKDANLGYIRLDPSNLPSDKEHFLVGGSDGFKVLNQVDLTYYKRILDAADKYNIKVIVCITELPGRVFLNIEEGMKDNRLWKDKKFWDQSFEFWKQLAYELKNHPAVVAYNPIFGPAPEKIWGHDEPNKIFKKWLNKTKGTATDLNLFNRKMLEAIRSVDKNTPVMFEGYFTYDVNSISFTEVFDDPNILYPFYNPPPWQYANYESNNGRYSYPDKMPNYWNSIGVKWDISDLQLRLRPIRDFIKANKLATQQVIIPTIYCDRRVSGCADYLKDILSLFNKEKWHWAFLEFRNDTGWTIFDYELGVEPMGYEYWWKVVDLNADPETLKVRKDNPIWREIQKALE